MIPSDLVSLPSRAWRHYRSRGLRSFLARVRLTIRYGAWGLEPVPERLPEGVVVTDPRGIFAALDAPHNRARESTESLPVSGWACSREEVDVIEVFVDDLLVSQIRPGILRPDVARRVARVRQANRSGFATEVPLDDVAYGRHLLVLAIRDGAGRCRVIARPFERLSPEDAYDAYYRASLPSSREARRLRRDVAATRLPALHLWIDGDSDSGLLETIRSIVVQKYPRWHCTILLEDLPAGRRDVIDAAIPSDHRARFRIIQRPASATEEGTARGTYHGFLRSGETLAPHALLTYGMRISAANADLVYSDHDAVDSTGRHVRPCFAPDWSPDHLLSRDYIGGFFLVREEEALRPWLADVLPSDRSAWRYELVLTLVEGAETIVHLPRLLWSSPLGTADPVADGDQRRAVLDTLGRRGVDAQVTCDSVPGVRCVRWALPRAPKVSIVIPTTGNLAYVRPCVESLRRMTAYTEYELVFLDNGRGRHPEGIEYLRSVGVTVMEKNEPFNWAKLSNDGARASDGELLLFLNDDVEAVEEGWLGELVSQATRPGIGAVGAMLHYPDGAIQHAGVFLVDHGGGAMHFFQRQDPDHAIYLNLHRVTREVSANTGACLMVHRQRFEEVGGFDERFTISGNDVDFCLRLIERGYRNIWTPHSRLIHHESVSRASFRVDLDEDLMQRRWRHVLGNGDPYFNVNFAQQRSDCSVDLRKVYRGESVPSISALT